MIGNHRNKNEIQATGLAPPNGREAAILYDCRPAIRRAFPVKTERDGCGALSTVFIRLSDVL